MKLMVSIVLVLILIINSFWINQAGYPTTEIETKTSSCTEVSEISWEKASTVVFSSTFTFSSSGTLHSLMVTPQFIPCFSNVTEYLNLTVFILQGDLKSVKDQYDNLYNMELWTVEYLNKSVLPLIAYKSLIVNEQDPARTTAFTCNQVNQYDSVDHLYPITIIFDAPGQVNNYQLSNLNVYTAVFRFDSPNPFAATISSLCVDTSTSSSMNSFVAYSQSTNITATDVLESSYPWSMEIAVNVPLENCTSIDKSANSKIDLRVWYEDQALAVIIDYINASALSEWYALVDVARLWLLKCADDSTTKDDSCTEHLDYDEVQNFYDNVDTKHCLLDVEIWGAFGLCLGSAVDCGTGYNSRGSRGANAYKDAIEEGYNLTQSNYYGLDSYIRIDEAKLGGTHRDMFHYLIIDNKKDFLSRVTYHMREQGLKSFQAFGLYMEPLTSYYFDVPDRALFALYAFLGAIFCLAIVAAWYTYCVWRADNMRISGIILFGLYTGHFYANIIFDLNLLNYPRLGWLFLISLIFLVVPWIANLVMLSRYQNKWTRDSSVRERVYQWFITWQRLLFACATLTGNAFAMIELVNSYAFGFDFFCMGLSERHLRKFNQGRLYTNILAENLPHLAIQAYVFRYDGYKTNIFLEIAVALNLLSLLASILENYRSSQLFGIITDEDTGEYIDCCTLSFQLKSKEIQEHKQRFQISTFGLRNLLGEILSVDPRSIEMYFPISVTGGFKVKFTLFSTKVKSAAAISLVQAFVESGEFAKRMRIVWDLYDLPEITEVKTEDTVVINTTQEARKSLLAKSEKPSNIAELEPEAATTDTI